MPLPHLLDGCLPVVEVDSVIDQAAQSRVGDHVSSVFGPALQVADHSLPSGLLVDEMLEGVNCPRGDALTSEAVGPSLPVSRNKSLDGHEIAHFKVRRLVVGLDDLHHLTLSHFEPIFVSQALGEFLSILFCNLLGFDISFDVARIRSHSFLNEDLHNTFLACTRSLCYLSFESKSIGSFGERLLGLNLVDPAAP